MVQGNPAKRWTSAVDNTQYGQARNFGQSLVDIFTAKSRFQNQLAINEIQHQQELRHHAERSAVDLSVKSIFEDQQHGNRRDLERYRVDQGLREHHNKKAIELAHDLRSWDAMKEIYDKAGYEGAVPQNLGGVTAPNLGNAPAFQSGFRYKKPKKNSRAGSKIPKKKNKQTPPTKPFLP